MRPKERRESGQTDLLRSRLDQILNMDHALVKLTRSIDWRFLEQRLGAVYDDDPGRPPLPTRLMTGLAILKSMHNLSDEALCERWLENPYYQLLCGEEFFQHRLPFDRSSLTRWHLRMGEERLMALLQESLAAATRLGAAKPADFRAVIVDTTVQEKAITFPTDAKLMHRARERLVTLAKKHGIGPAPALCAGRQVRADQASALCPLPSNSSAPTGRSSGCVPCCGDPRHYPQARRAAGTGPGLRPAAVACPARQGPAAARARPQGLFPACSRDGMHRQGQGPQAL